MKLQPWMLKLERKLGAITLNLLALTLHFRAGNQPPQSLNCLYAFWHRNLLITALQRRGDRIAVLASMSQDGELIAGPLEELGYTVIRGSSRKQGSRAFRQLLKIARETQIGITPDGPKGPPYTIHPGILNLALLSGYPIIPVTCQTDREWVFNSWDRFRLPKPFAQVIVIYHEPIYIKDKEQLADAEQALRDILR